MVIIIDLDLQQAVQSFGSRQPAPPIQVKSQDTPTIAFYFAKGNVNYDLGASPGIRFGVFTQGNPNPLVQYSSFNRTLDAQSRVTYVGYPNFNTIAMAQAIGTQASLACIGEVRYQTTFGTIARTLDLDFTVLRSLLNETILDSTTAAFTVPAVGSNVTIAISNTGWLSASLNLTIGNGAGAYQVVSITDASHFVAKNLGGTGNAAPATVIPTGTSVGIAQSPTLPTYPDPSIIELTTHKGVANGYAGLDANTLLLGSRIPVDGQTISVLGSGKIGSSFILTTVAANFTTPTANANVTVNVASTSGLVVGQYVRIPIAGYYIVESITDGTHAVLQNNGDPFNAIAGTTITSGAVLLPAQAAAGGGGGTAGQNAFSNLTASFTVPASGSSVSVALGSTSWLGGSGYIVFIAGAGYYAVNSVTDATHAVLTNLGYANTNAGSGTVIPSGAQVSPGGVAGAASTSTGANAYDATTASFTMPAAAGTVNIAISNTGWLGVGQEVFIQGAGYFNVQSISSPTIFVGVNSNYPGAAAPGTTIGSGAHVSPAGLIGPQGAGGAGLNAFTILSASFVQPATSSTVAVVVGTTAWMVVNQVIYVAGGGYYSVSSIGDLTHATLTNLGYSGNATAGATVPSGGMVSPGGLIGPSGSNPYTSTTANFTMPASGSSVTVPVVSTAFMVAGQNVYVQGAGYFTVASITDTTHVVLTNSGASGNVSSGSTVASGAGVVSAGAVGPAGTGGGGGTLTDATTTTGLSWISNPSGILKRAVPGSSNLTITDTGSTLVLDAPGAGGGGGLLSRLTGVELFDDFTGFFSSVASVSNPILGWFLNQDSGSGAGIGIQTVNASGAPELGVWQLSCQSSGTTSLATLRMGPATSQGWGIGAPNAGALTIEWRVKQGGGLNTSANYAEWRLGILGNNSASAWIGVFFLYNVTISPNWQCYAYNGSTLSSADSGVAVSATAYQRLTFTLNSTWTTATFSINGTTVATITGVSWAAATPWTPIASVGLRAGAGGWQQFMDWFYLKYSTSRP